jgi:prepilin-type N-terminal cleavage/methylation domain-containing protein
MKLAMHKTSELALKKAGAAVQEYASGFTLLELLVVIIIIGILSSLAYSSFVDIIFTNRAKETAQTIRGFTERALADAKRKSETVEIILAENSITAKIGEGEVAREALGSGYERKEDPPVPGKKDFENEVTSEIRLGLSGITKEGYFAACDPRGYCGGVVKLAKENSLKAYIKKGNKATSWEAL